MLAGVRDAVLAGGRAHCDHRWPQERCGSEGETRTRGTTSSIAACSRGKNRPYVAAIADGGASQNHSLPLVSWWFWSEPRRSVCSIFLHFSFSLFILVLLVSSFSSRHESSFWVFFFFWSLLAYFILSLHIGIFLSFHHINSWGPIESSFPSCIIFICQHHLLILFVKYLLFS